MDLDVYTSKKKLCDQLGDNFKSYLRLMKLWFTTKMTKENFDFEARKFFSPEVVHLHNEFLLRVLNKCQIQCPTQAFKRPSGTSNRENEKTGSSQAKKKLKTTRVTFERRFQSASVAQHPPPVVSKPPLNYDLSQNAALTDIQMIHGRMFVTAWDYGLDFVSDDSVKLMFLAVRNFLRSLLMAIISKRKAYKVREGRFQYAVGGPAVNCYLRNSRKLNMYSSNSNATSIMASGEHVPSLRPSLEWAESEAAFEIACDDSAPYSFPPISLFDLYNSLQIFKGTIPLHTVYSINMERILARMYHRSSEELEQEEINRQELALHQELEESEMRDYYP